ncbi:MAG: trp operon repressor [Candidatus Marinimicrobia bacterium]|nr:trp operon repressor [Candidatus Neomarinimicrobiota bacterium]MCF7839938.1 trp operon repressor [Candidatus Neomarinimicrobiota bacterium]
MKQPTLHTELLTILSDYRDRKELENFLQDLLTPNEIEEIGKRWELIKLLVDGVPQREIAKQLGISLGKISRGAHELKYGHDGFKKALAYIREHSDADQKKS